jgi:hypothetical protein
MASAICCGILAPVFNPLSPGGPFSLAAARSAGTLRQAAVRARAAIEQKARGNARRMLVLLVIESSLVRRTGSAERERKDLDSGI